MDSSGQPLPLLVPEEDVEPLRQRIQELRAILASLLTGWLQYDESADRHFCLFCHRQEYGVYSAEERERTSSTI